MSLRPAYLALSCLAFAMAQACGGDDTVVPLDASPDGTTDDGGGTDSGGADVGTQDDGGGGGDAGVADGGGGDGATDGGSTSNVTFVCPDGGAATDCSQCGGAPQPCVYCNTGDAGVLLGRCRPMGQNCFQGIPNGFEDCRCGADASVCPESYQVCTGNGRCHTCSDGNQNDGRTCQNGGTCNAADGGCN